MARQAAISSFGRRRPRQPSETFSRMLSPRPSQTIRPRALLVVGLAALMVALPTLGGLAVAAPSEGSRALNGRIEATRDRIARRQAQARVLSTDVARYSARVRGLEDRIRALATRQQAVGKDLSDSRAALGRAQAALRGQQRRLMRLRGRLRAARTILAARLVELYQADKPDLVGVVLNSNGFVDLLERAEFMATVRRQDARVIAAVAEARRDAAEAERSLTRLERHRAATTARIQARSIEIADVKRSVERSRASVATVRDERARVLAGVRLRGRELRSDLVAMEREQSRVRAALARAADRAAAVPPRAPATPAAGPRNSGVPSPAKKGSGDLIWPVNGPLTSPFGPRWGRLHAGIDIAVPIGTPVRAALGGTVTIAAVVGAYGNYVCLSHDDGLSTCYAHNSSLSVRVGQRVEQGDTIAAAGNSGISTGPHLHFETRVGGTPRDPMLYL